MKNATSGKLKFMSKKSRHEHTRRAGNHTLKVNASWIIGLGAVLAITPPELGTSTSTGSLGSLGGTTGATAQPAASTTAAPAATKSATATPAAFLMVAPTVTAETAVTSGAV